MRSENFLVGVWLEGGEEKNVVGSKCFLLEPIKMFSSQNVKKTKGSRVLLDGQKCPQFLSKATLAFYLFILLFIFFLCFCFSRHFGPVWYIHSNTYFQFLNNIIRIFTHFFIHTYFHTYF